MAIYTWIYKLEISLHPRLDEINGFNLVGWKISKVRIYLSDPSEQHYLSDLSDRLWFEASGAFSKSTLTVLDRANEKMYIHLHFSFVQFFFFHHQTEKKTT